MMQPEFPFLDDVWDAVPAAISDPFILAKGIRRVVRPGSHLIVVTVPHALVSAPARAAIARFRLAQYVEAGLYDPKRAARYVVQGDPSLDALMPHDVHIAVGDHDGRFLAYLCVQSALPLATVGSMRTLHRRWPNPTPRLRERQRAQFPVETEYGDIYREHPGLRALPLHGVRELSRLVRDQTLMHDPLAHLAVTETLVAGIRLLCDRSWRIEAIVGCVAPEARVALRVMGIPIAYSPDAPVVGDNLGGGSPTTGGELLWAPAAHERGKFWPFAVASADLRLERAYYEGLDRLLAQRLDAATILQQVHRQRRNAPRRRGRYVVSAQQAGGQIWTDRLSGEGTSVSRAPRMVPSDLLDDQEDVRRAAAGERG